MILAAPTQGLRHRVPVRVLLVALAGALLAGAHGAALCRSTPPPIPEPQCSPPRVGLDWRAPYDAWVEGDALPDVPLLDQRGRALSLACFKDRWLVLGFVFTRCPNPKACPLTIQRMKEIQAAFDEARADGRLDSQKLHLIALTLDPDFDQPPQMAAWLEAQGVDTRTFWMATGERELMEDALPSLFGVLALPAGESIIKHTVKIALVAPGLEPVEEWSNNEVTAAEVLDLIAGPR